MKQEQVDSIASSIIAGNFSFEAELAVLMEQGYDRQAAEKKLTQAVQEIRQHLFTSKVANDDDKETGKAVYFIVFLIAVIGPVFNISSIAWYIAATFIAAASGYFGYRQKPAAGIAGCVLAVLLFPIIYQFYFEGRRSYLNIELAIPAIITMVPVYLTALIIDKIFYSSK